MYVYMYVVVLRMHIRLLVLMHVSMYVCIYVNMYVYMYDIVCMCRCAYLESEILQYKWCYRSRQISFNLLMIMAPQDLADQIRCRLWLTLRIRLIDGSMLVVNCGFPDTCSMS